MTEHVAWARFCRFLAVARHDYWVESVRTRAQLEAACRLLYRKYRSRGYCEPVPSRLHHSPFMFGAQARTFVLEASSQVAGTVSVFPDGPRGIPLESLYGSEVADLRQQGLRFAEMGLLATERVAWSIDSKTLASRDQMLPVFLLFKIGVNYTVFSEIDHLLIVVHPRHRKIYELFGFRQFAEEKSYRAVCGNAAVPMIKRLADAPLVAARPLKEFFFATPFANQHFSAARTGGINPFAELFGDAFQAFHAEGTAAEALGGMAG